MNYQALDFNNYFLWSYLGMGATLVCLLALVCINVITGSYESANTKTKVGKTITAVLAVAAFSMLVSFIFMVVNISVSNNNDKVATQNIMQKYDVKDVLWKDKATGVRSKGIVDNKTTGELLVELNSGEKQVYLYEVNPETSEPTLKDSPIRGTTPADSLLKN